MLTRPGKEEQDFHKALQELNQLRRFTGAPAEFWPTFLSAAGRLIGASRGLLILRDPAHPDRLKKLSEWAASGHADRAVVTFTRVIGQVVEQTVQSGSTAEPLESGAAPETWHFGLGVSLQISSQNEQCVAGFLLLNATAEQASEQVARLQLIADVPNSYRLNHEVLQARTDVEKFASIFDVMVGVNAEKRFLAASLAFCNGLASRFGCERVSLGWVEHGYVRLRTISRTERFDRHMAAVKSLEVAMEECVDQEDEIVHPVPEGSTVVARDHGIFAREQNSGNICSLPLRIDSKAVGVLTCERQSKPFSLLELQQFRLACDQAVRRLVELKRHDRWFGARLTSSAREKLAQALGPEHTWAKVLSLIGVLALIALCLPIFNYRVEGNFIVRSDDVAYLTAPFEGYISQVHVRPGDLLEHSSVLLHMDTSDLQLEEAAALAELTRHSREVEKARAEAESGRAPRGAALAEMRIAQALVDQTRARLDLIRYRLEQAAIKAPFDAVLVEGDLRQRLGAPLKQGEALFRLARLDSLYLETEINERDVHEILNKAEGEVAFVTQPKLKYPVRITRVEPAAFPKSGQNVFVVRCALAGPVEPWWRPGMSGICKIDVEKRTLLWILTHRTVDFLRMLLWW